jgi:glyoxylase-like metal-dependent hydrolase (beta-lactamase superfamily II)
MESPMQLPVSPTWFTTRPVEPGLSLILEPHVHVLEQANIFVVEGRDRDMVIDAGMGVAPLRPVVDALRPDPDKPLLCLVTHTHLDHIGGAHEFETRLVHPLEADELARPTGMATLMRAQMPPVLLECFARAGYPPIGACLIDALPHEGYDPTAYVLHGAPATGLLEEGDTVDLGDRRFTVLHLPGHSRGQIGLFEEATGTLFGADAIYDGPLIYDAPGMSVPDYIETFRKLRALDVRRVHGDHRPLHGAVGRWLRRQAGAFSSAKAASMSDASRTAPCWRYSIARSAASCASRDDPATASPTTRQW